MSEPIHITPLRLKSLVIQRQCWGEFEGQFKGEIEFDGPNGKIAVVLPPDLSLEFIALSSDILAKVSTEAASRLKADIQAAVDDARKIIPATEPIKIA